MDNFGISQEIEDRLRQYQTLLLKWQEKINLISPSTTKDSWNRHFLDSLQLLPLIPKDVKTIYDLGSGAGFAGMVIAIARPDVKVTLVESDSKKCAFLQTVSRETGAKVDIKNIRIEKAVLELPSPELISARALAPLPQLLEWIFPWVEKTPQLQTIFPKGQQATGEVLDAEADGWLFHVKQTPSVTDRTASILSLSSILRKE